MKRHQYSNYSGLPVEMQVLKATKEGQNRLRLFNSTHQAEGEVKLIFQTDDAFQSRISDKRRFS